MQLIDYLFEFYYEILSGYSFRLLGKSSIIFRDRKNDIFQRRNYIPMCMLEQYTDARACWLLGKDVGRHRFPLKSTFPFTASTIIYISFIRHHKFQFLYFGNP
jgi:hypothetical protein